MGMRDQMTKPRVWGDRGWVVGGKQKMLGLYGAGDEDRKAARREKRLVMVSRWTIPVAC